MLSIHGSSELRRIVVINPKGGAGKTTLASNIAGYFATKGKKVAIIDMDKLGTSTHWLGRRPAEFPVIHGVFAAPEQPGVPADFSVTLPPEIELAVVDVPAGVPKEALPSFTVGSHAIVVPVMPSEFDVHAASRLIADLLLVARVSRENGRLGVIANRVKERTIAFKQLMKFLNRLSIPVIGVIRDSQNYVSAAREGLSIHELPRSKAGKDLKHWESVTAWLEQRLASPLNERDLQRPVPKAKATEPARRRDWRLAAAALLVLVTVPVLIWSFNRTADPELGTEPVAMLDAEVPEAAVATQPTPALESTLTEPAAPETPARAADAEVAADFTADLAVDATASADTSRAESAVTKPEPERIRTGSSVRIDEKWRLSGVARGGGNPVVFLTDTSNSLTQRLTATVRVDGWRLKEAGADYALLEKDNAVIRLKLSE